MVTTLSPGYGLHNNTRCSGHYRLESVFDSAVEECRQKCASDANCAKFSLELGQTRGCFLYDAQAPCSAARGFVSGFKGALAGRGNGEAVGSRGGVFCVSGGNAERQRMRQRFHCDDSPLLCAQVVSSGAARRSKNY